MVQLRKAKGYVYIVSNPSMPGLLKIGMTNKDPKTRVKQLYTTGVPTPFVIERIYHVNNTKASGMEARVHSHLARYRVNSRREFFRIEPDEAHRKISHMLNTRGLNYRAGRALWRLFWVIIMVAAIWYIVHTGSSSEALRGVLGSLKSAFTNLLSRYSTG